MRSFVSALAAGAFALVAAGAAQAQGTVKIGIILPYSGPFADGATQMDNAIKLWVKQNGDTIAGKKLEFIRKDVGGIAPDVAKRLAQELVGRDNVDILAGFLLTPNAMAAGDVSAQAKKFITRTKVKSFPMLWDKTGSSWAKLGVPAQPAWMLIARSGEILASELGEIPYDDVLTAIR